MRKGLLEFCTLLAISKGEMYVSDIIEALKKADMLVVEGTLYPLLSRLKSEELLEYVWAESSSGPPRKYYSLTAKGKKALEGSKVTWHALHTSITSLLK
jgi:PadR family transcriptional regulator, regulatory protein PadR